MISNLAGYQYRQTFSGVFIDDVQYLESPTIGRAGLEPATP
jgi:hypothetical protein